MRIAIRRTGAFGDVVTTTPVPRRLKREHPDAVIHFVTQYPGVYDGNPDVELCNPQNPSPYNKIIDLDLAFEKRGRWLHSTDCYFLEAFGDVGYPADKQSWMAPVEPGDAVCSFKDHIVIHPARSWPHRTFSLEFWQEMADYLTNKGQSVVVTGTSQDWPLERVVDTRNEFTPRQQVHLVQSAKVLIASESGVLGGVMHCTDTPAVGLITMGTFGVCAPYRNGRLGYEFYPIFAKTDCHGCTTRQPGINVTDHGCLRESDKFVCVTTFNPIEVANLALKVARG